jgi:hypothetical protein
MCSQKEFLSTRSYYKKNILVSYNTKRQAISFNICSDPLKMRFQSVGISIILEIRQIRTIIKIDP